MDVGPATTNGFDAGSPGAVDGAPALRIRNLSKWFGPQAALRSVDMDVARGEIHALVGQNGSGKSTLVKILAGYHTPGSVALAETNGSPFALGNPVAARNAGLCFVHQDLGLIGNMSVSDNFRLQVQGQSLRPINGRAEQKLTKAALLKLGYQTNPGLLINDISESERTAVALARALDRPGTVPLLVLDEPTASMPKPEVDRLFAALRKIAKDGTAILFISHHLNEVLDLADRVTVLRDGVRVTTTDTATCTHEDLIEFMLGRRLLAESMSHHSTSPRRGSESPRLSVRRLLGAAVDHVSFDVYPGRILGIAGLTGSGRDEIASLLAGHLPRSGVLEVDGKVVPPRDPHQALELGLCCVPADRVLFALLTNAFVRENVTISNLDPLTSRGTLRRRAERTEVQGWLKKLDVQPPQTEKIINELSGGNQQKVIIARWLRVTPSVLVLDEPTQGVDVGAKADIHKLVREAAAQGVTVVVCSSDSDELVALSDEILIMRAGRIGTTLSGADITSDRIEHEQLVADDRPRSGPDDETESQ